MGITQNKRFGTYFIGFHRIVLHLKGTITSSMQRNFAQGCLFSQTTSGITLELTAYQIK